jgi:shikimate kinase
VLFRSLEMNIVLTGFMGTGKTAVGRHLANDLHTEFMDVDAAIAGKAKKSISKLFATDGEAAFRTLESEVIAELSRRDKTVIAAGCGALLNAQNRENLQRNGILVCLSARVGTLLERLKDDVTRPLLAGENLEQRLERLMKERQAVYDLCPVQVATDGKSIAQVAGEIIQKVAPQWQA